MFGFFLLLALGLWLIYSIIEYEFGRCALESSQHLYQQQLREAESLRKSYCEALDRQPGAEADGASTSDSAEDQLRELNNDPTSAEVAEFVSPRPRELSPTSEPKLPIEPVLNEVQQAVDTDPDLAVSAIRQMIHDRPNRSQNG